LQEGVRLTINALFYICNYPARQKKVIDPNAPKQLAAPLLDPKSKPAHRISAERVLADRGFGYVTLCADKERTPKISQTRP